eukprot:351596-Chlamydomonas_euryale.AAC.9
MRQSTLRRVSYFGRFLVTDAIRLHGVYKATANESVWQQGAAAAKRTHLALSSPPQISPPLLPAWFAWLCADACMAAEPV